MPLYTYRCDSCDEAHDVRHAIEDATEQACPTCGDAMRRVIAAPPFALKGEGWHVTDYPKGGANG